MRLFGKRVSIFGGGMRRIEFVLPYVRDKDVLDIGVVQHIPKATDQQNWLHRHIRDAARSCVGIDTAQEGIAKLQREGFDVRLADAQNFDLDSRFDVVVAGDIVEHLHDLRGFFTSVKAHLRANGRLILLTPNPWFWVGLLRAAAGKPHVNPEHTAWYCIDTLTELISRFGFVTESATYGSSENFLWRAFFVPRTLRHTSIWVIATLKPEGLS